MLKYSDIVLQPLKSHRFKLVKSFKFKDIEIHQDYSTDGASIPRPFWCIFPPNRTDYLPCAIIHDYLCDKKQFKKADKAFHDCLEELGVSYITRKTMYYAVRIYHLIRYRV